MLFRSLVYLLALWFAGMAATKSLKIATMGIGAALVQLTGYGTGFIKAYTSKIILGKGRDIAREIEIRKGKNEGL